MKLCFIYAVIIKLIFHIVTNYVIIYFLQKPLQNNSVFVDICDAPQLKT